MSNTDDGGDDLELARSSRKMMVEACAAYADAWEATRGSIVTGYVCVFEVTVAGKAPLVAWITGNGAEPATAHSEGLARHRIMGLLDYAMSDVHRGAGQAEE